MKRFSTFVAAFALILVARVAGADDIKIAKKIPFSDPGSVRDAIKAECDLENQMAQFLEEMGKGRIKMAGEDVKKEKGRVLDAKIVGVWAAGGPWGAASIRVEGELRDDGKVVGTVASRRNTTRGGGACSKLMVSARKVAEDIAEWTQNPSMDAKLGDAAK